MPYDCFAEVPHHYRVFFRGDRLMKLDCLSSDSPALLRRAGTKASVLGAIGLTLLTVLASCDQHADHSTEFSKFGVLRRGLGGDPASLDPAGATDTFSTQVLQDLYEGLTTESPTGDVLPGVASSWSLDGTGTQYTFQLRPNARWSNGKPVRAQEFVTAWRRVVDPKQGSPVSDDLRLIAGATEIIAGHSPPTALGVFAPNDNVLVVKLVQPAPYFPQLLTHSATFPIYSDASARAHDPSAWISNGPYVLSAWEPATRVALSKNESYWDRTHVHIPRIEYHVTPDQNSQLAGYRAGQIDITDTVPSNAIPSLRSQGAKELVIAPYLATAYYALNLSAPPFASNLKLRKALAMAVDRQRLVTALAFGQAGAFGFVPPGTWNYDPQPWQWKDLNDADRVAEAKRLYAEAGYSANVPLRLRLLFNTSPAIKQTAIIVAAMWKEELGIDTELIDEEYRVYLESRHDRKRWEVVRLGWIADYNDATNFLNIFREGSANNDSGYANTSFEQLLNEAAHSTDPQVRRGQLELAERVMLGDYPVIPLYFFVSKRLVKPYVIGVQPNPLDRIPSKGLTIIPH
jgi:oligopeptide transport system substrate-binding protein